MWWFAVAWGNLLVDTRWEKRFVFVQQFLDFVFHLSGGVFVYFGIGLVLKEIGDLFLVISCIEYYGTVSFVRR